MDASNRIEKGKGMIVALHTAPKGFFKTIPPHSNSELVRFILKTASLGFEAVQIGPLTDYVSIEGRRLKEVLDGLNMERSVHVGGVYDAKKFALTEEEYERMRKQIRYGITLSKKISSTLVSIHPPFFEMKDEASVELLAQARMRFFNMVREEVDFAHQNHVRMAIESFCYRPFIFDDLNDFRRFVSKFPSERLGVLVDLGHLYQIGIDASKAIRLFKGRLVDVHVHDATLEQDYRRETHLPIGRGTIDFPLIISLLQEVSYDDWLSLEIRGNEEEIVHSKNYLTNLIHA